MVEHLAEAGYRKIGLVKGYFCHKSGEIDFTLVVEDFLIKYTKDEDLEHYKFMVDKDVILRFVKQFSFSFKNYFP